jgi:hypothetical protein
MAARYAGGLVILAMAKQRYDYAWHGAPVCALRRGRAKRLALYCSSWSAMAMSSSIPPKLCQSHSPSVEGEPAGDVRCPRRGRMRIRLRHVADVSRPCRMPNPTLSVVLTG